MPNSAPLQPKRRITLRGILVTLIFVVAFAGVLVLFAPSLFLRVLNFVPQGDVQTFWMQITPETTLEPGVLPSILSTRLPHVILVPTATEPVPWTPTAQPTLMLTPTQPTQTPIEPTEIESSATPTKVVASLTPTSTNPFAEWFSRASEPSSIKIQAKGYLELTLHGDKTFADALWVGEDANHQPLGIVEFDEAAIPQLCALYFSNCRNPRFRIDRVDFHPGGMEVYGSLNIGNIFWQQVGAVLLLDVNNVNLQLAGLVWNGELYQVPKSGSVATILTDLTNRGNKALSTLTIDTGVYHLTIAQLYFDDHRFIAVLRNAT